MSAFTLAAFLLGFAVGIVFSLVAWFVIKSTRIFFEELKRMDMMK